jgi:hypothetical protein
LKTERPVGVRAVNRLAKEGNALGAGSVAPDLPCGRSAVQVPRGGLHAELVSVRFSKQRRIFVYVVGPPVWTLFFYVRIEVRLLLRRRIYPGMLSEIVKQRSRSTLRGTDDQKIREATHVFSLQ